NRVAVMEGGRIVELGSVLDVFKNPQEQITKRFVQQVTEPEETKETAELLLERYHSGQIVQLTFIGEVVEQPVITNLIRNHKVTVNILQGKISQTQSGSYGTLFIHLDGDSAEVNKAVDFIRTQQVGVEVVSNG
ncbi:MAG: NIL domain-containing protein, partial [Neobacillus sp.]